MKKVINIKEIITILISVVLITVLATTVNATGLVLGDNNTTTITGNEYDNAQTVPEDKNTTNNTTNNIIDTNNTTNTNTNNNSNTNTNNTKVYNTNNTTDLPQTGIEDYNVGILLIICVASAIYAYRKINDYRSI